METTLTYYHLGSWTTITDEDGNIEQELSFDAWGNLRNPESWIGEASEAPMFDRGFTGHEHLYGFGLINMNGRMYDPIMSSFLSVDNYVQSPENSQNFNRYAYCLNNPLKYTDPSGEFLTWSIGTGGFSVGLNFTPAGVPLGFGINVGWANGGSVGLYGECAYRVGGTGLGVGGGYQASLDYHFATQSSTITLTRFGFASYGCFSAGGSESISYDLSSGTRSYCWGVNAGIGFGRSDGNLGGGLSVGYGSGGWSFGANGYYNKMQMPYTIDNGETVSVVKERIPARKQLYKDDCLTTVLCWIEDTGFGNEHLGDNEIANEMIHGVGDDDGNYFYGSCNKYNAKKQYVKSEHFSQGKISENVVKDMYNCISDGGRVVIGFDKSQGYERHSVGVESMTPIVEVNKWGKKTDNYRIVIMDPCGGYRTIDRFQVQSALNLATFRYLPVY